MEPLRINTYTKFKSQAVILSLREGKFPGLHLTIPIGKFDQAVYDEMRSLADVSDTKNTYQYYNLELQQRQDMESILARNGVTYYDETQELSFDSYDKEKYILIQGKIKPVRSVFFYYNPLYIEQIKGREHSGFLLEPKAGLSFEKEMSQMGVQYTTTAKFDLMKLFPTEEKAPISSEIPSVKSFSHTRNLARNSKTPLAKREFPPRRNSYSEEEEFPPRRNSYSEKEEPSRRRITISFEEEELLPLITSLENLLSRLKESVTS